MVGGLRGYYLRSFLFFSIFARRWRSYSLSSMGSGLTMARGLIEAIEVVGRVGLSVDEGESQEKVASRRREQSRPKRDVLTNRPKRRFAKTF